MLTFRESRHLLLLQLDDPHSRKRGDILALTKQFLRLKPAQNETKGGGVNIFLTFSLAYKSCFFDKMIDILKSGLVSKNKQYTISPFISLVRCLSCFCNTLQLIVNQCFRVSSILDSNSKREVIF